MLEGGNQIASIHVTLPITEFMRRYFAVQIECTISPKNLQQNINNLVRIDSINNMANLSLYFGDLQQTAGQKVMTKERFLTTLE